MAEKMLIDASHPEETRVVVVRGNRIEEFDFESQHKKQLRGNIYLAKVTRVEPSLQAAFVDYGGNRHGFLAFSEIHPDYYQIPLADRQALLEAEAEEAEEEEKKADARASEAEKAESSDHDEMDAPEEADEAPKPKKRRRSRRKSTKTVDANAEADAESNPDGDQEDAAGNAATDNADDAAQAAIESPAEPALEATPSDTSETPATTQATPAEAVSEPAAEEPRIEIAETSEPAASADDASETPDKPDTMAAMVETDDEISEPASEDRVSSDEDATAVEAADEVVSEQTSQPVAEPEAKADVEIAETQQVEAEQVAPDAKASSKDAVVETTEQATADIEAKSPDADQENADQENSGDDSSDAENIEQVGSDDVEEEIPVAPRKTRKQYRIQEVIKRRQILLVQIVKEERGNKGAALTTYMSLAGRYSVLMPNTARGGGISRKITNVQDRKRLKEVARELEVPQGMGVILRTAGASRTKTEIRRDFEYLMRLWENVRNLTLSSTAPCLVYEEGSLIKRSVRDLYNKDIGEVIVSGEDGYREAKDFMKMLMPSHAKVVQPYRGARQLFVNYGVEAQLDQMMSPQVTLKSGGYLIINQTEALVAVDVNSGRSTRESSIEDTALQTNLEAAEEVARQLRLRDLAGLVVIDFIDMEEKRNNRSVEKRLKDFLKNDRARIQVGRISHFGLLEMSRQRIRASVLESTTQVCALCEGTGHTRSDSSLALHILRAVEEQLLKAPRNDVNVRSGAEIALYILNQKRDTLLELEQRYGITISIHMDPIIHGQGFVVEKGPISTKTATIDPEQLSASSYGVADEGMMEETSEVEAVAVVEQAQDTPPTPEDGEDDGPRKRRRRRRRRGRGNSETDNEDQSENQNSDQNSDQKSEEPSNENSENADTVQNSDDEDGDKPKKRRRRGKRGGRKNRERDTELDQNGEPVADTSENGAVSESDTASNTDEANSDAPAPVVAPVPANEPIAQEAATATTEAVSEEAKPNDEAEKPKKPRRRRTTKKVDAETESKAEPVVKVETPAPVAAPEAPKAEVVADEAPKVSRESRTNLDAIATEPVVTSSASADESAAPKKKGWWSRAFN
jgi:ribonuclease E